jgi:hypothetical protein
VCSRDAGQVRQDSDANKATHERGRSSKCPLSQALGLHKNDRQADEGDSPALKHCKLQEWPGINEYLVHVEHTPCPSQRHRAQSDAWAPGTEGSGKYPAGYGMAHCIGIWKGEPTSHAPEALVVKSCTHKHKGKNCSAKRHSRVRVNVTTVYADVCGAVHLASSKLTPKARRSWLFG